MARCHSPRRSSTDARRQHQPRIAVRVAVLAQRLVESTRRARRVAAFLVDLTERDHQVDAPIRHQRRCIRLRHRAVRALERALGLVQLPLLAQDLGRAKPRLEEGRIALVDAHVGGDRARLVFLRQRRRAQQQPAAAGGETLLRGPLDQRDRPIGPLDDAFEGARRRQHVGVAGVRDQPIRQLLRLRHLAAQHQPARERVGDRQRRLRAVDGAVERGLRGGDLVGGDLQLGEQDARLDVVGLELDGAGQRRRRLIEGARRPGDDRQLHAPAQRVRHGVDQATRGLERGARIERDHLRVRQLEVRALDRFRVGVVEREPRGLAQRGDRLGVVGVVVVRLGEVRPGQIAVDRLGDLERARDLLGRVVEPLELDEQLREVRPGPRRRRDRTGARAAARWPRPSSARPPRRAARAPRARTRSG